MAFSLSFLSQISSKISEVKVFWQIFIHTHNMSLAVILNLDSQFFTIKTLFILPNLSCCLNIYTKGYEPLNRKKDFMLSLRELHNEGISSEQTYDTLIFIFSESCCRTKIVVHRIG